MNILKRPIVLVPIALLLGAGAMWFFMGNHSMHHSGIHGGGMHEGGMTHDHQMDADGNPIHDEVNMPGLIGRNTTDDEVNELRALFTNHAEITRTVENLPNGIKTITETENAELRDKLVSHAVGMIRRVEKNLDPEIPIQSPTLTPIFEDGTSITTEIEMTDKGIAVIQTSTNPETVAALQKHAAEVSDLAERGMEAVHEQMMGN